ncbi:DELLA protein GAI1-like [Coffea eugenioides]|uniref:GRAS family protein RAM1-like n=1 Tax=Coffea arabica TaxID=13443 RepID=A0A6P6UI37_COFAR|nr:DELLA protein GAI1-like [Coffea arabica]XP_027150449.1 DELLA protein GAI1-like [Coffea eugenioides]
MDTTLDENSVPQIYYLDEGKKESPFLPLTSLEFLKQHGTKLKRLREGNLNELSSDTPMDTSHHPALSTPSLMKAAKAQLFKFNSQKIDVLSYVSSHIGTLSGLRSEVPGDLELALLLQAAAEKVANQQYVQARKLLILCGCFASKSGSPVQRVVYCFAEALEKKIEQEWGIAPTEELVGKLRKPLDEMLAQVYMQPAMMTSQQETPFTLFTEFTATESILNAVVSAKRVHLIDFQINNGAHWTLIMQALAVRDECPFEHLKISAVGTSKKIMEETGKWLSSFAETLNLPFSYKMVVSDLKDLRENYFELEFDEELAIYSDMRLWTQLVWPNHLKALMGVIRKLKPRIVVVKEFEANTNAPNFPERFDAALLLFSAMFDCINSCMDHHVLYRKMTEEVIFPRMVQNIIVAEGMERFQRHEKIGFWRKLFAEFGMVETDLTRSSLCEASLFLRSSERLSSCTVDMDGKCLIMGWKGAPFQSLSAWKLQNEYKI